MSNPYGLEMMIKEKAEILSSLQESVNERMDKLKVKTIGYYKSCWYAMIKRC